MKLFFKYYYLNFWENALFNTHIQQITIKISLCFCLFISLMIIIIICSIILSCDGNLMSSNLPLIIIIIIVIIIIIIQHYMYGKKSLKCSLYNCYCCLLYHLMSRLILWIVWLCIFKLIIFSLCMWPSHSLIRLLYSLKCTVFFTIFIS